MRGGWVGSDVWDKVPNKSVFILHLSYRGLCGRILNIMNIKVIMTFITEISRATIGHGIFSTQYHHSLSPHTYSSAYIHRNSRNCCVTTFITGRNIQGHAQQEARAPLFYAIIFLRCLNVVVEHHHTLCFVQ